MPVARCSDSVAASSCSAARRSAAGDPPCQMVPKPNSSMVLAMAGSRSLTPRQTPTAPRRSLHVMLVPPDPQELQFCACPRDVRRRAIHSRRQELVNSGRRPADPTYDTTARSVFGWLTWRKPWPRSRGLFRPGVLRRTGMSPLVYVTRARVVRAAPRRSPPWVTIEADLLAIDHVRDADDAHERHRPDAQLLGHGGTIRRSHRCDSSMNYGHDHCRQLNGKST